MTGQIASSNKMELAAWVMAVVRNVPIYMATDSERMRQQAVKMMGAARTWTKDTREYRWLRGCPFKTHWGGGLQADGDLWELAWQAVLERGPDAQIICIAKGHSTQQHIDSGLATVEQKEGNDWADTSADKGAWLHEPVAVQFAKWMQRRHANYVIIVGIDASDDSSCTPGRENRKGETAEGNELGARFMAATRKTRCRASCRNTRNVTKLNDRV